MFVNNQLVVISSDLFLLILHEHITEIYFGTFYIKFVRSAPPVRKRRSSACELYRNGIYAKVI